MDRTKSTSAQQIAQAASAFEQRRTGNHVPRSVTVVLSEGTLAMTMLAESTLSPGSIIAWLNVDLTAGWLAV